MKKLLPLFPALVIAVAANSAMAATVPAGWVQSGNAGFSSTADGDISLAPGNKGFVWISTDQGLPGVGNLAGVGGTGAPIDGSTVRSTAFSAKAGDALTFFFNYLTSDGAGFADYGWAQLLDASLNATLLFTARTTPTGNTVPGFSMPAPAVSLSPATVPILTGSAFSGIGSDSGRCFDVGCGHTGWIQATYTVLAAGDYFLSAGVTNWNDDNFDSALAIADIRIDGIEIDPPAPPPTNPPTNPPVGVPEPSSVALLALALGGALATRRRKASRSAPR